MSEIQSVEFDIKLVARKAESFPEGVLAAHQYLHKLFPPDDGRRYFGLSRPENGAIRYWAATEQTNEQEATMEGVTAALLKSGLYRTTVVHNYMENIPAIGDAFQELLSRPGIDPDGYCVEWYINQHDVLCMVKIQ